MRPYGTSGNLLSTDNGSYDVTGSENVFNLLLADASLRFKYVMGGFATDYTDTVTTFSTVNWTQVIFTVQWDDTAQ
jgi:hypothetical protein